MEFPFLKIPAPTQSESQKGRPNPPQITGPGFRRQSLRLEPTFSKLRSAMDGQRSITELKSDPSSIAPERALVLEVADGIPNFAKEAARLGFEYLGEYEEDLEPSADFYHRSAPHRNFSEKIYVALPTEGALRELLRLWTTYQSGQRLPNGFGKWGQLFNLLVDIRPWGPKDRLSSDAAGILASQLESAESVLRLELEFWHSNNNSLRQQFSRSIKEEVDSLGGQIIDEAVIAEIKYHGMLIELGVETVRDMVESGDLSLLMRDELMFIRPQTMSVEDEREREFLDFPAQGRRPEELGEPICAVFDGIPIQRHKLLEDWLIIDDPDDVDSMSIVQGRFHGTSMTSLIIHGDLNDERNQPINRKVYLRPLMSSPDGERETTLKGALIIDLVYRAVKRFKEGDSEGGATAPGVFLVNLSLGDQNRPFSGSMSPWARLIDYLSFKYNVLFLVSAGNITSALEVPGYENWTSFEDDDPFERQKNVLLALNSQKAYRTILSPSEAVNALTIGARNQAAIQTDYVPAGMNVSLPDSSSPNISSALGLGYRGAVKPDFLMPGGRELIRYSGNQGGLKVMPIPGNQFSGVKVACPSPEGDLEKTSFSTGTSVATALTSHLAHKLHNALLDEEGGSLHADMPEQFYPVVTKALLAHTARWHRITSDLDDVMDPRGQGSHSPRRSNIARLFGYGCVDEELAVECAKNRATLIGYGEVAVGEGNLYKIPLPHSLNGKVAFRSMTITIAWLAPMNPEHSMYKRATLDIDNGHGHKNFGFELQRKDQLQPNHFVSGKSTLVHEHFSGERAVVISQNDEIDIRIFCKAQAGELFAPVPYSIVVSFEVASSADIDVYNEIRQKLAVGIRQ